MITSKTNQSITLRQEIYSELQTLHDLVLASDENPRRFAKQIMNTFWDMVIRSEEKTVEAVRIIQPAPMCESDAS